jgi:hypothetical protein
MIDLLQGIGLILIGGGVFGESIASIIRERYLGRAALIRAERGDPELPPPPREGPWPFRLPRR